MWPFKGKTDSLDSSGLLVGLTDWHSHVLPGVDDGIKTMEDSLDVLRHFDAKGVKTLWLTPHIMEDYPNTTDRLRSRFEELRQAWDGKLQLRLASENMLDSLFEERLANGDLLPIGEHGDHLLVETSYFSAPMGFDGIIDSIMKAGYYPLLAHPERYTYMNEADYIRLHDKGVKMQLNYVSLVGGYGETAKKKSLWLLKNGFIDALGSDVHRLKSNQTLIAQKPSKQEHIEMLLSVVNDKNKI
ncbi:MAG: capsular biosynthesis protein [Muribaculaceae bacterium]|nr:capsular biosynthesis protein [Muribaculaceae bacterium]MDE6552841.1 capsular biosynthesis protein [Muribaculaceae bacterium]